MKFAILTLLGHECHACVEATLQQVQAALATPQLTALPIPDNAGRWAFTDEQGRKGMVWAQGEAQWSFVGNLALLEHLFRPRPSIARRVATFVRKVLGRR